MSLSDLLKVASQITNALNKWNMLGRISLTGGEPFLSPYLFDIVRFLEIESNIKQFDILTNGTCITDDHIVNLKKSKKLHQIQISLDGATKDVHDSIRGVGVFSKVIDNVKKLKQHGFSVSFMFTLMKQNKDQALKIIDFAEECGVDAITIERVTPCGHSSIDDILTSKEIRSIYESITLRANALSNSLTVRRLRPLWINTVGLCTNSNDKIGGFCPVGFTSLAILWDGTLLPCRRLEIPIGNVLKDGIFKVWYDSELLWRIRDKSHLKGKCHKCSNISRCGGCRAIAYETSGDYMGEDIQCWI